MFNKETKWATKQENIANTRTIAVPPPVVSALPARAVRRAVLPAVAALLRESIRLLAGLSLAPLARSNAAPRVLLARPLPRAVL